MCSGLKVWVHVELQAHGTVQLYAWMADVVQCHVGRVLGGNGGRIALVWAEVSVKHQMGHLSVPAQKQKKSIIYT